MKPMLKFKPKTTQARSNPIEMDLSEIHNVFYFDLWQYLKMKRLPDQQGQIVNLTFTNEYIKNKTQGFCSVPSQ